MLESGKLQHEGDKGGRNRRLLPRVTIRRSKSIPRALKPQLGICDYEKDLLVTVGFCVRTWAVVSRWTLSDGGTVSTQIVDVSERMERVLSCKKKPYSGEKVLPEGRKGLGAYES